MFTSEHKAVLQDLTSKDCKGEPLDQSLLLKPNTLLAKVLTARLMSMTPDQQQALKSIITQQNADALKALLPELTQAIDANRILTLAIPEKYVLH